MSCSFVAKKLTETARQYGASTASDVLTEGLREGKIRLSDISIRSLAESLMGDSWSEKLERFNRGGIGFRESTDAVDASQFSAITGQLLIDTVREKYKVATMIGDQIFTVNAITNKNLGTQIEPYLSDIEHDTDKIQPGMRYPQHVFRGQYVTYPAPEKYGGICKVTMEAVFSDLTGQIIDSAGSVGRRTGLDVEYRKLKVFLGQVNNHSWNGTSYDTYQTSTPWINKTTSFTLSTWRDINTLEQLFVDMRDPVTGKPIDIEPKNMFVMPSNRYNAMRIVNATETRSGDITASTGDQVIARNPLDQNYQILTSPHAYKILVDASVATPERYVLIGDFKKTFVWREVYPLRVINAPPQNPDEFSQDIALQVKASVFGVAGVRDPRFTVLATA